jgi:ferredoxin
MAYVINADDCIACGACEADCPEGAISESNGVYVIDAAKCTECGTCADVCPNGAPQKA